ncbi:MAG: [protein-PII] uridylyltransferase family protein [Acidimicrobiia bacterium]
MADPTCSGPAFGRALAAVVDDALLEALGSVPAPAPEVAVVALGSYARRELCPGSDVDVLLVHRGDDVASVADALWYPLWDAGFVLGHATRTFRETRRLAEDDLDTFTALLDARVVGGPRAQEAAELIGAVRTLARRRRGAVLDRLADDSIRRRNRPGPVAEMLAPNLKDGSGGLRDLHALVWAGWCVSEPGGLAGLVTAGALAPSDAEFLTSARTTLLDVRVALHRATAGRSDVLALQDQDAVAAALDFADADDLMRSLAAVARRVAWIAGEVWTALRSPPRRRTRAASVAPGLERRGDRLVLVPGTAMDGATLLAVAHAAARDGLGVDRETLAALRAAPAVEWNSRTRTELIGWLGAGPSAIEVFAALDHEDLVTRVLPEWAGVRYRPQRNAYHRFTVDRHLVETVVEAVDVLDAPSGPAARAAAELQRRDLVLLGALLHDIAKGSPGDHAEVGATAARTIATRMGYPPGDVETLEWLVRDHLLMADTATRRDLADPVTIERFAARVETVERLALLTVLTVADSRATGPAAWGAGKAALVSELFDRTVAALTGAAMGAAGPAPSELAPLVGAGVIVEWSDRGDGRWRCSVGADDRPGLLADVAGALALEGFDIETAIGQSLTDRRAAEVFEGSDRFGRLQDDSGRRRAAATIRGVLAGEVSVAEGLERRRHAYRRHDLPAPATDMEVRVEVALDESADAAVVEVFAPDEIGLLATVAGVFGALGLDVTVAKVATTGELAVDVFYVRDGDAKLQDPQRIAALEDALRRALHRD